MISAQNKTKLISILEHKNYSPIGDSLIIFPEDINTLVSVINLANRFGIKLAVIGNGSLFSDKTGPESEAVYLSTQKMNKIINLDKNNQFLEIEAGCKWLDIFRDLNENSLFFPLDPAGISEKRTFGGIFSTLKPFSAAVNYFTGIEFVTPDGELIRYGCKTLKNVAGYDLIKFMAGSFGQFGIITSLKLRIFPSEKSVLRTESITEACFSSIDFNRDPHFSSLKSEIDPNSTLI